MFETLETLSKRLPRPEMTGDPEHDRAAHQQYMANAGKLRGEAFACVGRSLFKLLTRTPPHSGTPSDLSHPGGRSGGTTIVTS
ncbi:MAG: hypothetical protein ACR2Q4_23355 [Geminicoccaceae bacterium]